MTSRLRFDLRVALELALNRLPQKGKKRRAAEVSQLKAALVVVVFNTAGTVQNCGTYREED